MNLTPGLTFVRTFDPAPITTLLCDADDNLFGSERPAFDASREATNRFLARFWVTAQLRGTAEASRREELPQHGSRPGGAMHGADRRVVDPGPSCGDHRLRQRP